MVLIFAYLQWLKLVCVCVWAQACAPTRTQDLFKIDVNGVHVHLNYYIEF